MKTYSHAVTGGAVALMFALVAIFGVTGTSPVLANIAAANYGGGDDVTICHDSTNTIEVPAVEVQSHIEHGDQLGACSTDAGTLTIGKVHLQKHSATQDWIELYNPSNQTVNLSDWQVCNAFSCDSLSGSVAPGEYAIVVGDASIHTEISVPWGVEVVVVADGEIGSDLMHYADIVKLRGSDGVIVDQMNWGNPDTSWPNYNEAAWNGLAGVNDQALARVSLTNDTNTAADWTNYGIPTVALDITTASGSVVAGESTEITWDAENPNGSDSALTIDLYWFDDNDQIHLIARDTPNDGSFDWEVPAVSGDVRVKIVAQGEENVLLNARAITEAVPVN